MNEGLDNPAKRNLRHPNKHGKKLLLIIIGVLLFLAIVFGGIWRLWIYQPAIVDPFDAKTLATMPFPLYYPTSLPSGFHIDKNSVSVPQAGVVVFSSIGPGDEKIYVSQEARPSTFNFGGYYQNFTSLKETVTNAGTIAVGRINNNRTAVGSLATEETWILANTTGAVPLAQLTAMLNSLAVAH